MYYSHPHTHCKRNAPRLMNGQKRKEDIMGERFRRVRTYSTDRVRIRKEGQTLKARTTEGHTERKIGSNTYEGQTLFFFIHWLTCLVDVGLLLVGCLAGVNISTALHQHQLNHPFYPSSMVSLSHLFLQHFFCC